MNHTSLIILAIIVLIDALLLFVYILFGQQ